tara:strand:- start:92 stop:382 length:291 start_codon:yes stop_codon:yes gene_type:complete
MNENQSIKETLNVIRKALEDDEPKINNEVKENILFLNQMVKEDGTISVLKENYLTKEDAIYTLNNKLDEVLEKYLTKWLDKNIPNYLEKYFKKKNI